MVRNGIKSVCLVLAWSLLSWAQAPEELWKGAEILTEGILLKRIECSTPRLQKWVIARVDVGSGRFGFMTAEPAPELGKPMPGYPNIPMVTERQRTRDFLEDCRKPVAEGGRGVDMVLAVNGSPWSPWCRPWTQKFAGNTGLLVSDGRVLDPGKTGGPALIVERDGKISLGKRASQVALDKIWVAIAGFSVVLQNGKVEDYALRDASLHPRTGYGLSQDGRYLYLLVVDGRQKDYSQGATIGEVGTMLQKHGAWTGMNMDGGGSATMVRELKGRGVVLNHHWGGFTRSVASSLGVFIKRKYAR